MPVDPAMIPPELFDRCLPIARRALQVPDGPVQLLPLLRAVGISDYPSGEWSASHERLARAIATEMARRLSETSLTEGAGSETVPVSALLTHEIRYP